MPRLKESRLETLECAPL
ncbi:hypothetical protein A2U01_0090664, partial [Trifolium medium]|nr:hypothetical protein [Trifolium medium]